MTRFVAEVSSNHGRDLARALAFVDAAADVGCDAVKFQQFRIDLLFASEALRADPALGARRAWELPEDVHGALAARARERGLQYSCTPFYWEAVQLLEPHVDFFKLASYQVLWTDLLREVASTGKPVVLATGMADEDEIARAVDALREGGCERPLLLHCVSLYPTPRSEANLAAIATLAGRFGTEAGWSDHTVDAEVVQRAVNRWGAKLVEFHLDLDGRGAEFAAGHCWLPDAAREAIAAARAGLGVEPRRDTELDGDGRLVPRPAEAHERAWRTDPSDGLRPLLATRAELPRARPVGEL